MQKKVGMKKYTGPQLGGGGGRAYDIVEVTR